VNGNNLQEGRVEICVNKVWGTVCQEGFSSDEAEIVCGSLGLFNGTHKSFFLVTVFKCSINVLQIFLMAPLKY